MSEEQNCQTLRGSTNMSWRNKPKKIMLCGLLYHKRHIKDSQELKETTVLLASSNQNKTVPCFYCHENSNTKTCCLVLNRVKHLCTLESPSDVLRDKLDKKSLRISTKTDIEWHSEASSSFAFQCSAIARPGIDLVQVEKAV